MAPKTFVVPLDGSSYAERALPIAEALAARVGGGLLLVSAQYFGPLDPSDYLDDVAGRYPRLPIELIATNERYAAEEIVEAMNGDDDRVVCMTTHGRGRLRWAVLGSVAEDVIQRADRPVLLVGRHCRTDFLSASHLLACVDGSDESQELAPAALEWAAMLDLDLRASMVVHPLDVESTQHADAVLAPIVAQFGGRDRVEVTMTHAGYVAGAIADLAADLPAAIIAMNSHARHGLARLALGSVTMGVLQLAPCPLLVTHPLDTESKARTERG